jgi:NADPH:quinone reductase-like Zn-dependent oxidoreductase
VDIQLMSLPVWEYLPRSFVTFGMGIGEDFSGVVEAAGKNSGLDVGDEVS